MRKRRKEMNLANDAKVQDKVKRYYWRGKWSLYGPFMTKTEAFKDAIGRRKVHNVDIFRLDAKINLDDLYKRL